VKRENKRRRKGYSNGFSDSKINYTGKIKEVSIGSGPQAIKVGGESCYPFHLFEGEMPNPPRIAFEVWTTRPKTGKNGLLSHTRRYKRPGGLGEKIARCLRCGADRTPPESADPNGMNRDVEEVVATVKKVADAITVPLLVWGCVNDEKDAALLRRVAELCEGKNVAIGPLVEKNYKQIGAMAIGYNQVVMASTPIDVNLAKQLNILLGNLGMPDQRMLIDPTTGGLGYGLEYSYSVMERDRMAALTRKTSNSNTACLQYGARSLEDKRDEAQERGNPKLGDEKKRSILMEAVTAMSLLVAGADILIMRHPDAITLVRDND